MTEKQNVATYARVRPYNPAINEDKKLTARCVGGNQILNQNGQDEDSYNFTKVFDPKDDTLSVFNQSVKPLLDYKILQGITSIFIVYGQSGSGKSFTLIGENNNLGILPMSLKYLLDKTDIVEHIKLSSIECYGVKTTKIGFYDLATNLSDNKNGKFDPYVTKGNATLNSSNAKTINITHENCLDVITKLQAVSHMAPTLKNPHSSRGHTVYFARVKMVDLEPVYFIAVDLAGSEGQSALGSKDEFVEGLHLAASKGKLELSSKNKNQFEEMYKVRSLEAGCINNGLTQLQSIFGELIKKKISKSQGLGLRKVLSSFITLNSAYAIMFTLSASANNNKATRATLNFAKQTQLVKVDTKRAKKKIDKDKIIRQLNGLIEQLRTEINEKDGIIKTLNEAATGNANNLDEMDPNFAAKSGHSRDKSAHAMHKYTKSIADTAAVFAQVEELNKQLDEAEREEAMWMVDVNDVSNKYEDISEAEMKNVFEEFDTDNSGSIDKNELYQALQKMSAQYGKGSNSFGENMLTMDKLDHLVEQIDIDKNGEIDFEEFKLLFTQSWFINMHENRLVQSLQRVLSTGSVLNIDDDSGDEDDDKEMSDADRVVKLEKRIVKIKESYEKEIRMLKERLGDDPGVTRVDSNGRTNDADEPLMNHTQNKNPCAKCTEGCIVM